MQLTAQDPAAGGQQAVLHRAVVISLFTWRRAQPSDPVDGADVQGWWGDSYPSAADDRIGSRLWLLRRRSITAATLRDAQRYCEEALQWLIDDGLVTGVAVTIARATATQVNAVVVLSRAQGDALRFEFDDLLRMKDAL